MSNIAITPGKVVVHFGSPQGEQYGVREERIVDEFTIRHPEFKIPGRDDDD